MDNFNVVCCLYCYMGCEDTLAKEVHDVTVIVPYKIRREKDKGKWVDKKIKLIPGYAFVYSDNVQNILSLQKSFRVKVLSYSDDSYSLRGSDLELARWIWNNKGIVGVSTAIHEGDNVKIISGALKETEGTIVQLDKRHRLAKVELKIGFHIWLSFDWLDNKDS